MIRNGVLRALLANIGYAISRGCVVETFKESLSDI